MEEKQKRINYKFIPTSLFRGRPLIRGFNENKLYHRKQANKFLRIKMLCLVENETKVLKTGGINLVKTTQTSVAAFISYYFKDSSLFSVKSFRNQYKA